ncbi:lysozyme [Streptomyces sp. NBC_00670]|jgi:lysozyme|uniref:lysozyme n=1 Tax=Streptomyces sp. NBC_00670 TaxID=2975804 RepID=UPI002E31A308|nr:lysozyme [Streptomyces sp. NBC_00670]
MTSRHAARTLTLALCGALLATGAAAPARAVAAGKPKGHDVSSHQGGVDWAKARADGAAFVYVKATESTDYRSPTFKKQYDGARAAGILRGAYHFAVPDRSSGATQAAYFVRNGGAWRADGRTLPPALDMEYNPYGSHKCYGLGKAAMVRWIRAFSDEVLRLTGRRPVLYTTANWWRLCTGDSTAFAADHALWIARHGTSGTGALPGGWNTWTFWQYATAGTLPGDQNRFNGSLAGLKRFARG